MIQVRELGRHCGAEITGVDLSQPLDAQTFEEVARAFFDHEVAVFPGQKLTPGQQIEFTRRFGVLEHHVRKEARLADHPEIFILSNILDESGRAVGAVEERSQQGPPYGPIDAHQFGDVVASGLAVRTVMARWMFVNSLAPALPAQKFWYWIHTRPDSTEERGGPFATLAECIVDARSHGFDEGGEVAYVPTGA